MTDPRTEAQGRLGALLEALADAVLDLFPSVSWSTLAWDQYLTLYGPAEPMILTEPVVPEEPQP